MEDKLTKKIYHILDDLHSGTVSHVTFPGPLQVLWKININLYKFNKLKLKSENAIHIVRGLQYPTYHKL